MNFKKEYLDLIKPLLVSLPFTIGLIVLLVFLTDYAVQYIQTEYQAKGTIKVDVSETTNNAINFNQFPSGVDKGNVFLTEVEFLKSRALKEAALKQLDFDISYYRIGDVQVKELYHDTPFLVNYNVLNNNGYNHMINVIYLGDNNWMIERGNLNKVVCSNELFVFDGIELEITKNESFLAKRPYALNEDMFGFTVWSDETLVSNISNSDLVVKPIDKSIHVANVYYSHPNPEKATAFINALMQSYVELDKDRRFSTFYNSLDFVNEQLEIVGSKLRSSEVALSGYKQNNQIVNHNQETNSAITKIRDLEMQKLDLDMKEAEMTSLLGLFEQGFNVEYITPNFESINDRVFESTYYQLYNFEIEKKEILTKYTEDSEEFKLVQSKIDGLQEQIISGLKKSILNIAAQREKLYAAIDVEFDTFKKFPDKERRLIELERNFRLNEQTYNYLYEKKMEFEILKSSNHSNHAIIDVAQVPKNPIWPNKPLLFGLAVFLSLFMGIVFSYIWFYFTGKVKNVDDLQHYAKLPVLATVYKIKKAASRNSNIEAVMELQNNLELVRRRIKNRVEKPIIVLSSYGTGEGKSFVSLNLAEAYAEAGKKVLLMDMDLICPDVHETLGLSNEVGIIDFLSKNIKLSECVQQTQHKNLHFLAAGEFNGLTSAPYSLGLDAEKLDRLKQNYDMVIVDTPPLGLLPDASLCMQMGDINLFLVSTQKTTINEIKSIKKLKDTYDISEMSLVLNGVKLRYNYYSRYRKKKAKFKPAFGISK